MHSKRSNSATHRFFAALAEDTFCGRLGVCDPPLVDYVAELLTRFIHRESLFAIRNPKGGRLDQVAMMLKEAEQRTGSAARRVHQHIGDFTLFWMGVYPEALPKLTASNRLDHLLDYHDQGRRSYYLASTYRDADNDDECEVLARLSKNFQLCVRGLGAVRREWEAQEPDEGAPPIVFH